MKRNFSKLLITVCCLMLMSMTSYAAKPKNLKQYQNGYFDLNKNGVAEQISCSMEQGLLRIYVNNMEAGSIYLPDDAYSPYIQIIDIDKKDGFLDIYVYSYADSDDICYAGLFHYVDSELECLWDCRSRASDMTICERPGFLLSADGKGNYVVAVDRMINGKVTAVVGNHYDQVKYNLDNDFVTKTSKRSYTFQTTFSTTTGSKWLVAAKKFSVYKSNSLTSKRYTIKPGTKLLPLGVYVISNQKAFIKFKTTSGKIRWFYTGAVKQSSLYEDPLFSNVLFAD